jgi:hypothetical protein
MRNDITAGLDADSELVRGKIFCGDRCDFRMSALRIARRVVVPMAIGRAPSFDFRVASTWAYAKRGITDAGMLPSIKR